MPYKKAVQQIQKTDILSPPIQEVGVYTFEEKKCQTTTDCWLLINLGNFRRTSASLPSGEHLFMLSENQSFATVLPAGSLFDFDYAEGRAEAMSRAESRMSCGRMPVMG